MKLILLAFLFSVPAHAKMPDSAIESLEAVVVTSDVSKQSTPLILAPGSYSRKDQAEIKEKSAKNLKDILNQDANVEFVGGPRSSAELPQIRGLSSDRILILDEGVRQNFQSGHNGRVFADFSLVETLEIVKGPWSALYGSGAMGGVINFRRSTSADYIARTGQNSGLQYGLDTSTASLQQGERITVFTKNGILEPLFSYHHSKSQDITLGGGKTLDYSASESDDYYNSLGLRFSDKHALTLKFNQRKERSILPLNPVTETNLPNLLGNTINTKQDFVADYSVESGNNQFQAKPYFRRTEVSKERVTDHRKDVQIVTTSGIDTWNNLTLNISDSVKSVSTVGLEYFRDENRGDRDGTPLFNFPNSTASQWGAYFQPTFIWHEKFSLIPGFRYDSFSQDDSTGQVSQKLGEKTSSKLYASYEYEKGNIFFAGWGQAFNAPRMQDLFVQGQHFPGNFFIPNPNLKPETAETFEIGLKNQKKFGSGEVWTLNGTYFSTRAKDFIVENVGATTTVFDNADRVRLEGFEITSQLQMQKWAAGIAYGQVRSKNEVTAQPLSDTPADNWVGQLQYFADDTVNFGTALKFTEKQERVPDGTSDTAGYFVEDFFLGYNIHKVETSLRINNAFDRTYRRHGAGINEVGRDVRFNVSYLF